MGRIHPVPEEGPGSAVFSRAPPILIGAFAPAALRRVGTASAPARSAITAYYGRDDWGVPITDPKELAETVAAYREFGADELVLYCYADDPGQVDTLAGVLGRG